MKWIWIAIAAVIIILIIFFVVGKTADPLIRWTAVGDDGHIGRAASYDCRWSLDSLQLQNNWAACSLIVGMPIPDTSGTPQSKSITQTLPSQSRIYVAIRAIDDAGNMGGVSNIHSFVTADNIPPARIMDLR